MHLFLRVSANWYELMQWFLVAIIVLQTRYRLASNRVILSKKILCVILKVRDEQ